MRPSGLFVLSTVLLLIRTVGSKAFGSEIDNGAIITRNRRQSFQRQWQHGVQTTLSTHIRLETFIDLVRSTSYHVEEHDVTTDDGYILTIHRIPGGPKSPVTPKKPVVLLIHGLLAASDVWVLRGPDEDLAFILVDAGYDVWLLNTRGNFYARRHKKLLPKEEKFWRFSWHESGVYDTASAIDHILKLTDQKRLSIIGHSMGTTISLVLLSMRPEYNAKVNAVLSFAPVAIFTHLLPGPFNLFAVRFGKQLQKTFKLLGFHEVFPRNSGLLGFYTAFCQMPRIELLCLKFAMNIAGLIKSSHFDAIKAEMIPKLLNHYPQGSSLETIWHYRQIIISGKFRQFDFGTDGNKIRYKNSTPPEYLLERITVPVILYYGLNDAYTTKEDVMALRARLPNAEERAVERQHFSHLDFLFSNYTKNVYDDVLRTLDRYRGDCPDSLVSSLPTHSEVIEYSKLTPTTVTV